MDNPDLLRLVQGLNEVANRLSQQQPQQQQQPSTPSLQQPQEQPQQQPKQQPQQQDGANSHSQTPFRRTPMEEFSAIYRHSSRGRSLLSMPGETTNICLYICPYIHSLIYWHDHRESTVSTDIVY